MRSSPFAALSAVAALCLSAVALASPASAAPNNANGLAHRHVQVCSSPRAGAVGCDAIRDDIVDANGTIVKAGTGTPVAGSLGPDDIRSAYNLTQASSGGKTVAIVDAYDDPTAENDLNIYRAQYGLPACTTANLCFQKVGQTGDPAVLPAADAGWGQEISLDLDMISATCPDCHILLVEANSTSYTDLAAAVTTAANRKVAAISNSYGGSDTNGSAYPAYSTAASHGIAVTASTGDSGYGDQSPASFTGVVAVGGTSLTKTSVTSTNPRGWAETAWSSAGSGCSRYNARPAFQPSTLTKCSNKANADVSAVADPNTGVAVYDSTIYQGASGWMQFGGTSASSPIIASVYALSGNTTNAESLPWAARTASPKSLNDVTTGSNGRCYTKVWCTAGIGWDGPTGLGTPNGTGAF